MFNEKYIVKKYIHRATGNEVKYVIRYKICIQKYFIALFFFFLFIITKLQKNIIFLSTFKFNKNLDFLRG